MFKKTTLPNGFRMIVSPVRGTRAATVLVIVQAGSKYERKNRGGVAHFLEHMLFKGTKRRPKAKSISEAIDRVGGEHNAFTGQDRTGFWVKVPAGHLDLALDLVSDMFLGALLKSQDMARERGVILEELNMYFDTPARFVWDLWGKVLYGDQPAGWYVGGTPESVRQIRRNDLVQFMKKHYIAASTIVCVSGNVAPREASRKIQKYFGRIPEGKVPERPPLLETQKKPNALVHFKKTDQTHFVLGVRAFDILHPERYALVVLATLLGGMPSSRLFEKLRDTMGAVYSVHTTAELDPDAGYLATAAGVTNARTEEVIGAVVREYHSLKRKLVDAPELRKVKEFLKGQLLLGLETSDEIASFLADQEALTGEILRPEEQIERIEAVRARDIRELARFIFRKERLNLALIGPMKNSKSLLPLLSSL